MSRLHLGRFGLWLRKQNIAFRGALKVRKKEQEKHKWVKNRIFNYTYTHGVWDLKVKMPCMLWIIPVAHLLITTLSKHHGLRNGALYNPQAR